MLGIRDGCYNTASRGSSQPTHESPPCQRLAILEYARKHDLHIDDFIEATASGQASEKRRRLDELTNALQPGDRLVVSELSRLGRSLGQVVAVLDALAKTGVAFVALKENIRVEGKRDIQTKVLTTLFALFAEVERDLISERTREGLAKARASGRKLGRPKGSLGVSRLDGKEDEIRRFLELGVSKTAIAKITGVSRTALYSFMTTRGSGRVVSVYQSTNGVGTLNSVSQRATYRTRGSDIRQVVDDRHVLVPPLERRLVHPHHRRRGHRAPRQPPPSERAALPPAPTSGTASCPDAPGPAATRRRPAAEDALPVADASREQDAAATPGVHAAASELVARGAGVGDQGTGDATVGLPLPGLGSWASKRRMSSTLRGTVGCRWGSVSRRR